MNAIRRKFAASNAWVKIFVAIVVYVVIWMLIQLLSAFILFHSEGTKPFAESLSEIIFSNIEYENIPLVISLYFSLINFLTIISLAVLASYIFLTIQNVPPKVLMPDKLVIRKRTSSHVQGQLSISIAVGNRSYFNTEDVTCTIHCVYKESAQRINAEFSKQTYQPFIKNFHRFSFGLDELPKPLLNNFLNDKNLGDRINIIISGKSKTIGGSSTFSVHRQYKLTDVIIHDNDMIGGVQKEAENQGYSTTSKHCYRMIWKKIQNHPDHCSELAKGKIVQEIENMLRVATKTAK